MKPVDPLSMLLLSCFWFSCEKTRLQHCRCCVTTSSVPPLPDGNVRRLLQSYPQEAEKARIAAPVFTRDALKTISGLEEQVLVLGVLPEP